MSLKKDYSQFGVDASRKDGANSHCKECNRKIAYQYKYPKNYDILKVR